MVPRPPSCSLTTPFLRPHSSCSPGVSQGGVPPLTPTLEATERQGLGARDGGLEPRSLEGLRQFQVSLSQTGS